MKESPDLSTPQSCPIWYAPLLLFYDLFLLISFVLTSSRLFHRDSLVTSPDRIF